MSYLPKAIVEKSIKKRVRRDKQGRERVGYEAYFGTDPFTKFAVRMTRASEEELKKDITDFYRRHQSGGDAAVRLTPIEAIDAKNALDLLHEAGVKISLADAVRGYLNGDAQKKVVDSGVTVGEAYSAYITKKYGGFPKRRNDGTRDPNDYYPDRDKAIATVGKWVLSAGHDTILANVTAKDVVDYLMANYGTHKPKTYNSHFFYLGTFFNWCTKDEQKYLSVNPIKNVRPKPEPWEEPACMKVEDVARLFKVLEAEKDEHPEYLAQAIVGFFCGTRACEIQRMAMVDDAAKIHLDDETVRIVKGKGYQCGKRPRAFHIEATAMAWIKSFDFLDALKKVNKKTVADIYKLARKHNIPVFQNCVRHTFITYHVAAFGDPAKTQAIVGTSAKYRAENYCALASKGAGEAYFKILPSANDNPQNDTTSESTPCCTIAQDGEARLTA